MSKRSVEATFSHYSSLVLDLIPNEKKEEAFEIFSKWKKEQLRNTTSKSKILTPEEFKEEMEKYLICENVSNFPVTKKDFTTADKSAQLIVELIKNDKTNHKYLLRSAALQGHGLIIIYNFCERKKKLFIEKLKTFKINIHISYAYFLMKLSRLFLPHQLLLNSTMPLRFIRKHFKAIENYVKSLNISSVESDLEVEPDEIQHTGLSQELDTVTIGD